MTLHQKHRVLLTGKNGQIGWELERTLATIGEVIALDRDGMDLARPDSIRAAIREIKPSIVVNAAAYTVVDKAEEESDLAMTVNGMAPGIIAEEAKLIGAAVVHYSTDYVFDGTKTTPYTEKDQPNPINVYGKTKLSGEHAIQAVDAPFLILRTSWVYSNRGKNFLLTILRLAKEQGELRIVDDQIGVPTWARQIAESTAQILAQLYSPIRRDVSRLTSHVSRFTDLSGVYHLTASGEATWYRFAEAIFDAVANWRDQKRPRLVPIKTQDYSTPARRPKNSRLDNSKLINTFGFAPSNWDVMLKECIQEMIDD